VKIVSRCTHSERCEDWEQISGEEEEEEEERGEQIVACTASWVLKVLYGNLYVSGGRSNAP
jgi:hypothetical protein